jgi:hypothetical protein
MVRYLHETRRRRRTFVPSKAAAELFSHHFHPQPAIASRTHASRTRSDGSPGGDTFGAPFFGFAVIPDAKICTASLDDRRIIDCSTSLARNAASSQQYSRNP